MLLLAALPAHAQVEPETLGELLHSARNSPLYRTELRPDQISARGLATVQLRDGVRLDFKNYVDSSSLRQNTSFQPVFQRDFQQRFLTVAPDYQEKILQLDDRLIVERKLSVELKPETCRDAGAIQALNTLCFRSKRGTIPPETAEKLREMRSKLAKAPPNQIVSGLITAARARDMTDAELLGLVLNTAQREVHHVSIIPVQIKTFDLADGARALRRFDLTRLNQALTANQALSPRQLDNATLARPGLSTGKGTGTPMVTGVVVATPELRVLDVLDTLNNAQRAELECRRQEFVRRQNREPRREELSAMASRIVSEGGMACIQALVRQAREAAERQRMQNVIERLLQAHRQQQAQTPRDFPDQYFLTGFTWGHEIEDKYEVTLARATWFTDRYYLRFSYYVGTGFGLRLPYKLNVSASPMRAMGRGEGREVSIRVEPVDAGSRSAPDLYRRVGMPRQYYFDDKEFVLLFAANCHFKASIPGPNVNISCPSIEKDSGADFVPSLGNRRGSIGDLPWLRGNETRLGIDAWLGSAWLDLGLHADMANGRIGYRVAPLGDARVELQDRNVWARSENPIRFDVIPAHANREWGIKVDRPRYNFDIVLTPQMRIRLNVDLGIYEYSNTIGPYRIDSLSVSEEFTVNRHDGTTPEYVFPM